MELRHPSALIGHALTVHVIRGRALIIDINEKITRFARLAHLKKTPDGRGFFGNNEEYGAYIEIISYSKALDDSRKRNRMLFTKLGLPQPR